MEGYPLKTCSIIGAGNVASHIAHAIAEHCAVRQIFSHKYSNAKELALKIGGKAEPVSDLKLIDCNSDLYIISVPDDVVADVLEATSDIDNGVWVHTSGSVDMDVFNGKKCNYGVFYPLQTFSKTKKVDMARVPMLIEGNNPENARCLMDLAKKISNDVRLADSDMRRKLHVAAVFACNFVNFMWTQADDILHTSGLDIKILKPLLSETLAKIDEISPIEGQTGPARRGDLRTIERHLGMLSESQAEIYRLLSKKIYDTYHEQD